MEIGFARLDRRTIFEGTTFPRSFRLRSVAQHRQQIGSPRITAHVFEGTTFPPSFRPKLAQQEARTLGGEGPPHVFRGNHFPSFRWGSRTPRWTQTLSNSSLLALHCKEVAEFRQYRKRARRCSDFFRQHPDTILAKVPKEMAPLKEMPNP